MKQDFLAKRFSLPTLSTVKYSSGYLPFLLYLMMIELRVYTIKPLVWTQLRAWVLSAKAATLFYLHKSSDETQPHLIIANSIINTNYK